MSKRKQIKKFWSEKVVPNKRQIAVRVIRVGVIYAISGPVPALAAPSINTTELSEGYKAVVQTCFGDRVWGIPVPRSYKDGVLCVSMFLTCAAAAAQGFGNPKVDAACAALIRALSENPTCPAPNPITGKPEILSTLVTRP